MKKAILILSLAILPFGLGGCSLFNTTEETPNTEETSSSPTPTAETEPEVFQSPTATPSPSGGQLDVAGLIPSTNPSQVKVEQGRSDPFATVPVQPIVTSGPSGTEGSEPGATAPNSSSSSATAPTKTSTPKASKPGKPGQPQAGTQGTSGTTRGGTTTGEGSETAILEPPPPPDPTEAKSVVVSGVLQLPTSPVAIVLAPGESVARQVTQGQKISNGQVLVKAIYATDNPMVVFEQYGIEVVKKVGEAPANAPAAPAASAETPAVPPAPNTQG